MNTEKEIRKQILVAVGLSGKEAHIYDLLLEQGALTGGEIERLGRQKKNTFALLKSLQRRGLVSPENREGKRFYVPAPPERIELILKEQKRSILSTQSLYEQALPEMSRAYKDRVGKPVVQYYSGIVGTREVFEQVYRGDKSEIWGCVGWGKPSKIQNEVINNFSKYRVERGIRVYTINNDTSTGREFADRAKNPNNLAEVMLIDPDKYPMPAEFDTWNDVVAMMSFENKDFSGVIIQNKDFATTMQSLFRLMFDLLRKRA